MRETQHWIPLRAGNVPRIRNRRAHDTHNYGSGEKIIIDNDFHPAVQIEDIYPTYMIAVSFYIKLGARKLCEDVGCCLQSHLINS